MARMTRMNYKVVIREAAKGFERDARFATAYQRNIKEAKERWDTRNFERTNPYLSLIQRIIISFGKIDNKKRYEIMSGIFEREISSTYDLTCGEATALLHYLTKYGGDFG